ncbi:glutamate ligase domain-containing protein, partial [uncultured Bifidobacterium sp.]|uniref:glutamate ligase domain-containing protein n=1 Tax=uncultured Bifidobacterium sp. TaxID=165187 RepID=UPI0028DC9591
LHDHDHHTPADTTTTPLDDDGCHMAFGEGRTLDLYPAMPGNVNALNAAAALSLALAVGIRQDDPALSAMEKVRVPGRMERFLSADGIIGYVDFAHNGASTAALLDYVDERYGNRRPRVVLVTGSAGNKAIDRRREIVQAAQGRVQSYVFTLDDPNFEDPRAIAEDMRSEVHDPGARTTIVLPREDAIREGVADARRHPGLNVVLVIGKGEETCNIVRGRQVPYEGDASILRRELDAAGNRPDPDRLRVEGS